MLTTKDVHLIELDLYEQWSIILNTYIAPIVSFLYSNLKTEGTKLVYLIKYSIYYEKLAFIHQITCLARETRSDYYHHHNGYLLLNNNMYLLISYTVSGDQNPRRARN